MAGSPASADSGLSKKRKSKLPKDADGNVISGFEETSKGADYWGKGWEPVSDRKVKVGIAGNGHCKFGQTWFYQNHPKVEVVGAKKTYPSCEEMIKDKEIEAVYIATDARSHGRVYGSKIFDKRMIQRPPLPPGANGPHHGASHGYLTNDFIESILLDKYPTVGISEALNMTLAGVVAHQSALKDGEWIKIQLYGI